VPANLGMIIDVVDNEDRVVSTAERRIVLDLGLNFRTVHVLLFDEKRRLLLQHLSNSHPRSPNRLGSSAAGYLYSRENYSTAANRKLREELQVTASIKDIGRFEMTDERSHKFVGVFTGTLYQKPTFADDLVTEIVRMELNELSSLIRISPSMFTQTFLFVYDYFRRTRHQR
jgi:isopentenyl-diphosphate Delta-isomerase